MSILQSMIDTLNTDEYQEKLKPIYETLINNGYEIAPAIRQYVLIEILKRSPELMEMVLIDTRKTYHDGKVK